MSRLFYHVMQDNVGNLLFGVTGTMRIAGTGTVATIYGDEALTVVLPNPMTNHPSFGSFKCFLGAGDYDFYMAKAGYTFETLTGVQGHGTMAQQDATSVAILGGTVAGVHRLWADGVGVDRVNVVGRGFMCNDYTPPSNDPVAFLGSIAAGANRFNLYMGGTATNYLSGSLGIGLPATAPHKVHIWYDKSSTYGLTLQAQVNDTGTGAAANFLNTGGASVGSISTTASATAYNTSSDGRLKEAVTALPQALETIQRLLPVTFRWKATGEMGQGFIAQDVLPVLPQAVTGDPDDPAPTMQMDLSKLVPHLVGACQELAAQVQALTARLAHLEAAGT